MCKFTASEFNTQIGLSKLRAKNRLICNSVQLNPPPIAPLPKRKERKRDFKIFSVPLTRHENKDDEPACSRLDSTPRT